MDKTIIFGNGINRLSHKNISWSHLLDIIKGSRGFNDALLPNTMIYERIILERPDTNYDVLDDEFEVKMKISELMENIEASEIYTELFRLNVQNYLTTNYDYAYIYSISDLKEFVSIHDDSTEDVYSIRRLKRISNLNEQKKFFWQIHGEIEKPASIMLGLDHYCGSIGKIDSYIKGWYRYTVEGKTIEEPSIADKFKNNTFSNSSWVELFFTSDIHIIGFSLDYSEIDLWWIINKRARLKKGKNLEKKIKNKIVYYCTEIDDQKKGLLESLDIEVQIDELQNTDTKYLDYYKKLIKQFKHKL